MISFVLNSWTSYSAVLHLLYSLKEETHAAAPALRSLVAERIRILQARIPSVSTDLLHAAINVHRDLQSSWLRVKESIRKKYCKQRSICIKTINLLVSASKTISNSRSQQRDIQSLSECQEKHHRAETRTLQCAWRSWFLERESQTKH